MFLREATTILLFSGIALAEESRLASTYASIQEKILAPKCVDCHSSGGRAENIPLDSYGAIVKSNRGLVDLEDVDASGLIVYTTTKNPTKLMPPPRSNIPPLTEEEVKALREWIAGGAKP